MKVSTKFGILHLKKQAENKKKFIRFLPHTKNLRNAFYGLKVFLWHKTGVSKLLCPRATQAITEHIEGRTSYVM